MPLQRTLGRKRVQKHGGSFKDRECSHPCPFCLSQANPYKAPSHCAAPCPEAFVCFPAMLPCFPIPGADNTPIAAVLASGWFPGKMGELWEAVGSRSRWLITAVQSPTSSGSFWPGLTGAGGSWPTGQGSRGGKGSHGPGLGGAVLTSCLLLRRAPAVSGDP